MGGCRCVYRNCPSSTSHVTGLHYFHFPVKDVQRCEDWIINARKPSFRKLEKDKLRNKVVCSLHFEEKCFSNKNHDRLIHNAVPTLGNDDYEGEENIPSPREQYFELNSPGAKEDEDDNIMLIPVDEDNTKFTLPDVAFSGMSYTIYDDAVIPSGNMNYVMNKQNEVETPQIRKKPSAKIKSIVKKMKIDSQPKLSEINKFSDAKFMNHNENDNDVVLYSVSSSNGNLTVKPSNFPKEVTNNKTGTIICEYINQINGGLIPSTIIARDTSLEEDKISLKQKSNNEFTIAVNTSEERDPLQIDAMDNTSQQSSSYSSRKTQVENDNSTPESADREQSYKALEKDYVEMIHNNSRDIKQLKTLIRKQNRLCSSILKQKQPTLKPKLNKRQVLRYLRNHVKPSLLAILKLELLPEDEVVLNDNEEKFITDLYMENSECYNLLKNRWKWKLPSSEKIDENCEK